MGCLPIALVGLTSGIYQGKTATLSLVSSDDRNVTETNLSVFPGLSQEIWFQWSQKTNRNYFSKTGSGQKLFHCFILRPNSEILSVFCINSTPYKWTLLLHVVVFNSFYLALRGTFDSYIHVGIWFCSIKCFPMTIFLSALALRRLHAVQCCSQHWRRNPIYFWNIWFLHCLYLS